MRAPDTTNPARGEAQRLGKLSFPGGIDNRRYPTKNTAVQEQSKARLNYLARGIHLLGPAALGYGLDMTRSLREELSLYVRHPVEVRRLALNLEQVRALNLPPNPAKESDARFAQYVEETGAAECWELDALSPTIIDTLLDRAIRELVDRPAWRRALAQEEEDPARLAAIADDFDGTEGEP
jgi:hypothetical protein